MRTVLRDPLLPRRGPVEERARPGQWSRRRHDGDLEPRVHAIRPRRPGPPDAAAGAVDRHRRGARAPHQRAPARADGLRHRLLRRDHEGGRGDERPSLRRRHGRRARHLGAGDLRSFTGDRVPDQRRRHPLERRPRLRAAQDHAARDAARQASRAAQAVPSPDGRGARARDGRRVSGAAPQPRDDREDDRRRRESLRCRPDRRPAASRGGNREGARGAGPCAARRRRRSASTTPSACPTTSSRTPPPRESVTVDRASFELAMAGQRDKARAQSTFGDEEGRGVRRRRRGGAERRRRSVRRLHGDACLRRTGRGDVRCVPAAGGHAGRRESRLPRAGADALLSRIGRPGVRLRAHPERGDRRRGNRRGHCRESAPGLPRAHRVHVTDGALQRARHRHGRCRCGGSRRHAPQSHRHSPAPRGASPGPRRAREAGRLTGRAGSPAVRFRALSAGDAGRDRPHRADRQRAHRAEHAGRDDRALNAGSDRRGRDGALR